MQTATSSRVHRCTLTDGLVKALVSVWNMPCACRSMASDLQAPSSQQVAPVGMLPNPFRLELHQPPNADQVNLQGEGMRRPALQLH